MIYTLLNHYVTSLSMEVFAGLLFCHYVIRMPYPWKWNENLI
jgi:hypothetical protein